MIKLKRPETTRKVLSTIVLGAGLITSSMFANTESNYSFSVGGGGTKDCLKQVTRLCISFNAGLTCPPGEQCRETFGINIGGTKIKCALRQEGTKNCTAQACSGAVSIVKAPNCKSPF